MEITEAFEKRSSVRKFSAEQISEEKLDKIISAGLSSPSGRNLWPSELVLIREKETIRKISPCKHGSEKLLESASCLIAVLGDESRSDTWIEDAAIVMSNLHLAAAGEGVGSCWVQCRGRKAADGSDSEDYVRSVLAVPANIRVLAILAMGIPAQAPVKREISGIRREKLHFEKY